MSLRRRRKHEIQAPNINRKMILRLRQDPLPILSGSEFDVKVEQNTRRERADLHVSQLLANATERSHGEWGKRVFVLDELGSAVPA